MSNKILVTGGAGYIGSHTCVELLMRDFEIVIVDNFINSSLESLNRIKKITGKDFKFYQADIRDDEAMRPIFLENEIDCVIHFAGLKAVGESVEKPLLYYENNVYGSLVLFNLMQEFGVKKIAFSSSATVYGNPEKLPLDEECRLAATNPYGGTKLTIENILKDLYISDPEWNIIILRYFNPVGAHTSGLIGEDPKGIPNNLTPYIAQVAAGKLSHINVFGNDYPTRDGTGVRDYIHVVDLALGHIAAIEKINRSGVHIYNLGTGIGYSVLEVIRAFEKASNKKLPYKITGRRSGDIAECYANADKAARELGWKAKYNIDDMCVSLWRFQKLNPNGYDQ
ncbi:MAG: UDP-glucose 4-epimerase GalE [Bacilli bacterium]|nr:UDP-glucose 4-epimerase GalE [Bacilli bacterium]MDD4388434.1 UDP-glucose 4-epimerase GalE [Bacilli bacterium]